MSRYNYGAMPWEQYFAVEHVTHINVGKKPLSIVNIPPDNTETVFEGKDSVSERC